MYENSIFVMYGDHYGISQNHNRAMSKFLEKDEITPFDTVQLQRVPLIIHIPGYDKNETIHDIAGQIDVKPTIMHLLGIEGRDDIQFGSDLFSPERESFTVLRDGSFITDDYVFTNGTCYDKATEAEEEIVDPETEVSACEQYFERQETILSIPIRSFTVICCATSRQKKINNRFIMKRRRQCNCLLLFFLVY